MTDFFKNTISDGIEGAEQAKQEKQEAEARVRAALKDGRLPRWEYFIVFLADWQRGSGRGEAVTANKGGSMQARFNAAGRDGWELVCIDSNQAVFKRLVVSA